LLAESVSHLINHLGESSVHGFTVNNYEGQQGLLKKALAGVGSLWIKRYAVSGHFGTALR
jgi:hypothetical protein